MNLKLLVPSRNRPENAARLTKAVFGTADDDTELLFVVDYDDPRRQDYLDLETQTEADVLIVPEDGPKRMGPVLNWAADLALQDDGTELLGFMGDDHLPRTKNWDQMARLLENGPGVVYGNDLFQGQNLPTAGIMTADLVRILGYMSPPPLKHLYIDNFWKELGNATSLWYVPDVIIEHLHPAAGKAAHDDGYAMSMGPQTDYEDRMAYGKFMTQRWPADRARLLEELGR